MALTKLTQPGTLTAPPPMAGQAGRQRPLSTGQPVSAMQGQEQPAMSAAPTQATQRPGAVQGFSAGQLQGSVDQQLAGIRAQLAQAEQAERAARTNNSLVNFRSGAGTPAPGTFDQGAYAQAQGAANRTASLRRQLGQQEQSAQQQAVRDSELARRDQVRDEIFGGARGRVDELRRDPTDQLILDQLTQRVQGGGPMTDEVVRGLFSQQGDMAAAAEAQQLASLGGRPGDPAYEAARRGITASRQGQLNNAQRDLRLRQLLTNYDSGTQSLGQLAGFNQGRNAQITEAERNLQGLLGQEVFNFGEEEPGFQDFLRLMQRREGRA